MPISRTPNNVVEDARHILQDEVAPYRYSDSDLLGYVAQGISAMCRMRPDLLVETPWEVPDYYASAAASTPLPADISQYYFTALVEYVAGMAELRDDQFSAEGRAAVLIATMRNAMMVAGG